MSFDPRNTRPGDDMPDLNDREAEHFTHLVSEVGNMVLGGMMGVQGPSMGLMRAMLDGTEPIGLMVMMYPNGRMIPVGIMVTDESMSSRITLDDTYAVADNPDYQGYQCDQVPGAETNDGYTGRRGMPTV